jgi:outer membrane protein
MKHLSLILNIVLVLAVGFLFYHLFGRNCKSEQKQCKIKASARPSKGNFSIAYIDLDSLYERIDFIRNSRKALENEQNKIEDEWESGYRNLETQKNSFMKRASSATQSEIEQIQNSLLQQQQQIDTKKQTLTQKLNEKTYRFLDDMDKKLKQYLSEYNQNGRFNFIFTTGKGMDYMVYKDSVLNITDDVVDGMNDLLKPAEK